MKWIKTYENFSSDRNDIFGYWPVEAKERIPWKGILSQNAKFDYFFRINLQNDIEEIAREKIWATPDFDNKSSDEKQKIFNELKSSLLKEHWSKMWISIEDIIKENNVQFFTHVSLNPNLNISSIKNAMDPASSDRAETLEDREKGDRNIKNKWGFYISAYDEDEKTDWDTISYMVRASEDIDSIFVYSIGIKPGSRFLRADFFDYKMISEMDEDSLNLVKSLGLCGVYSERPYGEDRAEYEIDKEGNIDFNRKSYYKISSLEICIVDADCMRSIKKDDDLKRKCIEQISKEVKYKSGDMSAHRRWIGQ